MQKRVFYIACIGLISIFIFSSYSKDILDTNSLIPPQEHVVLPPSYRIKEVIDGDTVVVQNTLETTTVRLIGINTPETSGPYRQEECYGKEASEYLKELLPEGSLVSIQTDPSQDAYDQYGRLLGYLFDISDTHINASLLSAGYAREYTYRKKSYLFQEAFQQLESNAREQHIGLWGACK